MSLAFCLIYATSCCTKFTPNYTILLFGRLTGGIATSLLFSVFEAWMVSEAKHRNYTETQISDIFAWATYVNGIVAIISGVVANGLVDVYGKTPFGFATPFLAALGILIVAFVLVAATWSENYGEQEDESSSSVVLDLQKNSLLPADAKSMSRSTSTTSGAGGVLSAIKEITQDVGILSVGCMQCFFESAMYTFVFMWSPQLESIKRKS